MSFNTSSIAENIQEEIKKLIELATGEKGKQVSAGQMERRLWWELLSIGRQLMRLFFVARSEAAGREKTIEQENVVYRYKGQRKRSYVSVFGKVAVWRAAYWHKGKGSLYPLDEALSLPERQYSDWVQEIVSELSVCQPYKEAVRLIQKWLPIIQPKRSAQQVVADHAAVVSAYYEQRPAPAPGAEDSILVVSADGKGIPMNRDNSPPPQARRGKGTKKTAKKEATVTAVYTISPFARTADDIIAALLPGDPASLPPLARPKPTGKQIFGTLAGKEAAFEHLVQQVFKRDAAQLTNHIALTDGSRALQLKVEAYLPDFTLILDIIHVSEYLWETANVLLGEAHPQRGMWVEDALRCLLEDDHETLFKHLDYQRSAPSLSQSKVKILTKVLNYLRRNQPYMNYQHYLFLGWPIGTGVIEGACRHLIKDRFEQAGMRWSVAGAQAMLDLRTVHLNDDWDDFQRFRRQYVHRQRYGSLHPMSRSEVVALNTLVA